MLKTAAKTIIIAACLAFLINIGALFHSYSFTHFSGTESKTKQNLADLSAKEKIHTLLFGVKNPRTVNTVFPKHEFKTVNLEGNPRIECWDIKIPGSKGTVILFHGYGGKKSNLLSRADAFLDAGYSVFMPDFMGSGGSGGDATTIGYMESEQVKRCYDYAASRGDKNIILFGISMGAAAIMKASADYGINPAASVLECPFSSLYRTICNRFNLLGVPEIPFAALMVFWGGAQHGFNGFAHNPADYAAKMNSPVILIHGLKDDRVGTDETDLIFKALPESKKLVQYADAGHETLFESDPGRWKKDVFTFLKRI